MYKRQILSGARSRGFSGEVLFGQAEGALSSAEQAERFPLFTLQSGPVAGVVGAARAGAEMGQDHIIVTDMGGTTLDVSTVEAGGVVFRHENELVRQLAYLRKVDVESVGAGGGSIAWTDGYRLQVGPQSAGADPGPAAYDRGGREPTVTDALVVSGFIDPENFFGGDYRLDADLSLIHI